MALREQIIEEGRFQYLETSPGKQPLLLLHGLMGALSNFGGIIENFKEEYDVVVPILPIFDLPLRKVSLGGLLDYLIEFIEFKKYKQVFLLGNSLGGHLAQLYTLKHPDKVRGMILTGSSGLFESAMGNTFPKRGDYTYIKNKVESVFYSPDVATKELVDTVFDIVNDRMKALHIVKTAKSAVRHNLEDKLLKIDCPTLLIWGKDDEVTPAWVGEKFAELIPNSKLYLIDECGHAPMMEKPAVFNNYLSEFLTRYS